MNKDYELAVAKPLQFAKDYGIDVSSVPAERGFFIVFGCSCKQAEKYESIEGHYIIQPYENGGVKLGEILEDYIRNYGGFPDINKIRFQISDGRFLDGNLTVDVLAKKAELESVEGMFLYIDYKNEGKDWVIRQHFETGNDSKIQDECALQQMYTNIPKSQKKATICIDFLLPGTMQRQKMTITIKKELKSTFNQFKQAFWNKLKNYYEFDPKIAEDANYVILARRQNEKEQHIARREHGRSVKYVNNLFNWCTVRVDIPAMAPMKRKKIQDLKFENMNKTISQGRLLIQKQNGDDFVNVAYESIQFMSFHTLYQLMLVPDKKRKDVSNKMCLKVMDILIHEDEDLSCLAPFFQHGQKNQIVRLVGKVVSEKMHFYNTMIQRNLDSKKEGFSIKSYIRSNNIGQKVDNFYNRVRQEVDKRAALSQTNYFKDPNNVEPVYVYSAEYIHVISTNKNSNPVYYHINANLREKTVMDLPDKQLKGNWIYSYISNLMSQLSQLEEQKLTVYRGVDYNPKVNIGDILTFKAFTSTSIYPHVAKAFQKTGSKKPERTLFKMHIRDGRKIDNFSAYKAQGQRLLEPYSQFEVLSVNIKTQKQGDQTVTFREIELDELDEKLSSKQFPFTQSHFVLWVDRPNSTEPFDVFNSITRFRDSTVLIVFNSTEELAGWLKGQTAKRIFEDTTSNIVFLTNMTRREANKDNPIAGIEAIRKLQQASEWQIPVMLYVGDKQRAQEKIQANKNQLQNRTLIKIGINHDQARRFLAQYIS